MKNFLKAFSNEILIIIISFFLYFIGILYSNDQGFYSRESLSSGSDDFIYFIGMTGINIFGIIFGLINLLINIILLKFRNKIINISYIVYKTIFVIQLFDLFSLWFSIYIIGTFMLILSKKLVNKSVVSFEFIKLKIIHKIIIIMGFIMFLVILLFINTYLIQIIKPLNIE